MRITSAFIFKQLSQILQPTRILWGESDKILGIGDANKFKRAIPQKIKEVFRLTNQVDIVMSPSFLNHQLRELQNLETIISNKLAGNLFYNIIIIFPPHD